MSKVVHYKHTILHLVTIVTYILKKLQNIIIKSEFLFHEYETTMVCCFKTFPSLYLNKKSETLAID